MPSKNLKNCVRRYTRFTGLADGSQLTTAEFHGVEYDVVPIMALKAEVVIRPMGSTVPEYVSGDVISNAAHTFANRPVVLNHPEIDSAPVTANQPEILESSQLGHIFFPEYDDGLLVQVYLNDEFAESVGDEGKSILADLRAGKSREVSIGAYVYLEYVEGVSPSGDSYGAIWLDMDGDHLAILESGSLGACDNAMGCGPVFNQATSNPVFAKKLRAAKGEPIKMNKITRKAQLAMRRLYLNNELSNKELRDKLYAELNKQEGDDFYWYGWIKEFYPEQGIVIFEMWDSSTDDLTYWQQSYTLNDDTIELADDKQQVVGFAPVIKGASNSNGKSKEPTITAKKPTVNSNRDEETGINNSEGDQTMPKSLEVTEDVKQLASAIVNCDNCPFGEEDRDFLHTKDEVWLEAITEKYGASEGTEDNEPAPAADNLTDSGAGDEENNEVPAGSVIVPAAKWAEVTRFADAAKQRELERRNHMIAALAKVNPDTYTNEFFKGMSDAQVEGVYASHNLNVPHEVGDFTLAGASFTSGGSNTHERKEIPSGVAGLRAKKQ